MFEFKMPIFSIFNKKVDKLLNMGIFLFFLTLPYYIYSVPPDHFNLNSPGTVSAGSIFYVTATAMNINETVMTSYNGTAGFDSSASQTIFPADYAYIAGDNGAHVFPIQLMNAGEQSLTIFDTANINSYGSALMTVDPGEPSSFIVSAPSSIKAGVLFYVTVTAKDAYNNTIIKYNGTSHFYSTDPAAVLPSDSTFQNDDYGVKVLPVMLKTKGTHVVSVVDLLSSTVNGSSNAIDVTSGIPTRFSVSAPTTANPGTGFNLAISAMDAFNNVVDWYTGMVHFTSTDAGAVLPGNYTFQAGDYGNRIFSASLLNTPTQSISVNDAVANTINGSSGAITVSAGSDKYSQPLMLTSYLSQANMYQFVYIMFANPSLTLIPNNAYLEYDVFIPEYSADFYTGTEFGRKSVVGSWIMRDFGAPNYLIDQNAVRCHPSMDLKNYASGKWYHRKFNIAALNGLSYNQAQLAQDTGNSGANGAPSNSAGTFNGIYDNIKITDSGGGSLINLFSNANTIPMSGGVSVDGNIAGNRGDGGISTADATHAAPLDNYIWLIKDMSLTASPASNIVADGVSPCTITANLFAPGGAGVSFALADFVSDRGVDTISPVAVSANVKAITDGAGNAKAVIRSTKAGAANITVRSAHISKIITVNFVAGPSAKVRIIPDWLSIVSGVNGTIKTRLEDAYGNFSPAAKNVTITSSSGSMRFSSDNGSTWSQTLVVNGMIESNVLVNDTTPGDAMVTASAALLTSGSAVVHVNDSPAKFLSIIPVTQTAKAGNQGLFTIRSLDASGNNCFSTDSVFVTPTSATMMFSLNGNFYYSSITATLIDGRADVYYKDTKVGVNVTVTAKAAGYTDGKAYFTTIANDPAILDGWSDKYAVTAGQSVTITAKITDLYGNAIAGKFITFTAQVEGGLGDSAITPSGNSTNASGLVTVVYRTKSSSAAQNYCIINSTGLLGKTLTIAGSTAAVAFSFLPNPLALGADINGTLYINAKDTNGYNAPPGTGHSDIYVYVTSPAGSMSIFFSKNSGASWFNSLTTTVDSGGSAQLLVRSHVPGTYVLMGIDTNSVTPMAPAGSTLTVSTSHFISITPSAASSAQAGGTHLITAQIVDQNGTPVSLQGVRADFSTNNGSVSPVTAFTDSTGKVTTLLSMAIAPYAQHLVTVSTTSPDSVSTTGSIISIPVITFDVSLPATATKLVPVSVVVRARDAYGATITNYTGRVHLTSTDGGVVLSLDYTFLAGDKGVKTFGATFSAAGTWTVTATDTVTSSITGTSNDIVIFNAPTPSPTFTATRTNSPTKTVTPTITQTWTNSPTYTITNTHTVSDTPTFTITRTSTPTFTETFSLTPTGTATPTRTATGTYTGTSTATPTITETSTKTATPTITQTHTDTPVYSPTPTSTQTPTSTATPTKTATGTNTATLTPSATRTVTQTATCTSTKTITTTITATYTNSPVYTRTMTPSITVTFTGTSSKTITPTVTPSPTSSNTPTITPTKTATSTLTATRTITQTHTVSPTSTHTPTITATPTITLTPVFNTAAAGSSYVCPQPAKDNLSIVFNLTEPADMTVYFYNAAGMPVGNAADRGFAFNANKIDINLKKFAPGVYFYVLRAKTDSGKEIVFKTGKFLVIK